MALQTNIYCLVVRYEMCCDMVDVMLDVSSIYGYPTENDSNGAVGEKHNSTVSSLYRAEKISLYVVVRMLQAS